MSTYITMRRLLALFVFALLVCFLGASPTAYAGDDDEYEDFLEDLGLDDDLYEDLHEDFYEFDRDEDYYAKRWDKLDAELGGGHGGAGATHVPVIDEDWKFMVTWTEDLLRAEEAHRRADGGGITVAVLDGGFDLSHPTIAGHVWPFGFDAIEEDFDPEDFGNGIDDDGDGFTDNGLGHGTFVAGMVTLAAPGAMILPIRIRDDEGWSTSAEVVRGLEFAWAAGADIVNISGAAALHDFKHVREMIERMRADGILVVVSTGNDGLDLLPRMALLPGTLPVASSDENDRLTAWSNHDASVPTLLAPGVDLYGPLWGTDSGYWSGTSFSAGLVSGGAALVLARWPWLSPSDVSARLLDAADPAFDRDGGALAGSGRLNLFQAVTN